MILAHKAPLDPIILAEVQKNFNAISLSEVAIETWQLSRYLDAFTDWMTASTSHSIKGLDQFPNRCYTAGTSEAISAFINRHSRNRRIRFSQAEFIFNKIISNSIDANWLHLEEGILQEGDAVLMSLPFSGTGSRYYNYYQIIDKCNQLSIPVFLDLAYFGISHNLMFDFTPPCITDIACSLSKPFYAPLRAGIRFTRELYDDYPQALSSVLEINRASAEIAINLLQKFPHEYIISKYLDKSNKICNDNNLKSSNTITLAEGNAIDYPDFLRNGYYRVCITEELLK